MRLLVALFVCLFALPALAQDAGITVERPTTMEMPEAVPTAGVFMIINNAGAQADRLVGVSTDAAGMAMLHTTTYDKSGVAEMRHVNGIDIPANGRAILMPGFDHVMLDSLTRKLVKGDTFELGLKFEKAGDMKVTVDVVSPEELVKRFPAALAGDRINAVTAKTDISNPKSFLDRLREKIQSLGRKAKKDEADPASIEELPTTEEMEARMRMEAMNSGSGVPELPKETHAPALADPVLSPPDAAVPPQTVPATPEAASEAAHEHHH